MKKRIAKKIMTRAANMRPQKEVKPFEQFNRHYKMSSAFTAVYILSRCFRLYNQNKLYFTKWMPRPRKTH